MNAKREWRLRSRPVETPGRPPRQDGRKRPIEPVVLDGLPPVEFTGPSGNPWSGKP